MYGPFEYTGRYEDQHVLTFTPRVVKNTRAHRTILNARAILQRLSHTKCGCTECRNVKKGLQRHKNVENY